MNVYRDMNVLVKALPAVLYGSAPIGNALYNFIFKASWTEGDCTPMLNLSAHFCRFLCVRK